MKVVIYNQLTNDCPKIKSLNTTVPCVTMMKMKCTDDVMSLRRMVSAYANTYHVIAIISLYHEISNDTDLNISFVRFEPRTQHPVSDVVSPHSYRY